VVVDLGATVQLQRPSTAVANVPIINGDRGGAPTAAGDGSGERGIVATAAGRPAEARAGADRQAGRQSRASRARADQAARDARREELRAHERRLRALTKGAKSRLQGDSPAAAAAAAGRHRPPDRAVTGSPAGSGGGGSSSSIQGAGGGASGSRDGSRRDSAAASSAIASGEGTPPTRSRTASTGSRQEQQRALRDVIRQGRSSHRGRAPSTASGDGFAVEICLSEYLRHMLEDNAAARSGTGGGSGHGGAGADTEALSAVARGLDDVLAQPEVPLGASQLHHGADMVAQLRADCVRQLGGEAAFGAVYGYLRACDSSEGGEVDEELLGRLAVVPARPTATGEGQGPRKLSAHQITEVTGMVGRLMLYEDHLGL